MQRTLTIVLLALGITALRSAAEVLVLYDFEGEVATPSFQHARVAPSNFTHAPVGGTQNYPAGHGDTEDAYSKNSWPEDTTLDDYYQILVTIDPGFVMTVTNLTFWELASEFGPTNWTARYSTDGSTFHTFAQGDVDESWGLSPDIAGQMYLRDLTGTVWIRLYAVGATDGNGTWRLDDVTLSGTIGFDGGVRTVKLRDYDGSLLDLWEGTTKISHGSTALISSAKSQSGAYSLELSRSTNYMANPSITFDTVDLRSSSNNVVSVGYAADDVDSDDDLWLDISYDDGLTWNGVGSTQLVAGFNQYDLEFGSTGDPARVPSGLNPYEFPISASETQIALRVRFEEASSGTSPDYYYIDDVQIRGVVTPPTNAPVISNYGDPTIDGLSATIPGILHGGYPYPEVRLYWGLVDGDTNTASWSHEENLGVLPWQPVSRQITGLEAGTTYYYRWYAVNEYGDAWSAATTNFSTATSGYAAGGRLYLDSFGVDTVKPLCIDDDDNDLSDRWEDTYLAGADRDPDHDPDGDGVITRLEQLAGTHPNDSESYMRILNVDIADASSSNIVVQFIGGYHTGPTQYVAVGDSIQRTFRVLGTDDASQTKDYAGGLSGIMAGTNAWTDTNMVIESSQRYYGIGVTYAGSSYSNSEEWAVYVQPRTSETNYKYLVSVPVDLGPSNNLNSTLGQQLARGLHAGSGAGDSDQVWHRNATNGWDLFYLKNVSGNKVWTDMANSPADFTVTTGMGLWVVRNAATNPPRNTCVFAGKSFTDAPAIAFSTNNPAKDGWHWNVFGWPFATPKHHVNSGVSTPTNQLGFSAVGYGGKTIDYDRPHEDKGDQIWIYENNSYRDGFWLMNGINADHNGRWWSDRTQSFADFQLEAGKAYFYRHHEATNGTTTGVDFDWTPTP